MDKGDQIDQFQLLEDKVNSLINRLVSLKDEKEALSEKAHIQEEKISNLTREVDQLKQVKDNAKQRIITLLEKMEQLDIE